MQKVKKIGKKFILIQQLFPNSIIRHTQKFNFKIYLKIINKMWGHYGLIYFLLNE